MPMASLAKVFGPTIVGHSCPDPAPSEMWRDTQSQPRVTHTHTHTHTVPYTNRAKTTGGHWPFPLHFSKLADQPIKQEYTKLMTNQIYRYLTDQETYNNNFFAETLISFALQVVQRLMSISSDYWRQYLSPMENPDPMSPTLASPGAMSPASPEVRPVPASPFLGSLNSPRSRPLRTPSRFVCLYVHVCT